MKRGRKNVYATKIKPRLLEIAAWARDGLIEKDMCKLLGVSVSTFSKHKAENPELMEALKTNKAIADINVENSLYKRAIGYKYKETTREIRTGKDGKVLSKYVKEIEKEALPDTTAQIFFLKNRMVGKWRDKHKEKNNPDEALPINVIIEVEDGRKS